MLPLHTQERWRARYRAERLGHVFGLDAYTALLDALILPGARVLDVGCGPGGLVAAYVDRAVVVGVDPFVTQFAERPTLARLAEGASERLPFAAASFDIVTCSWVLEHLPRPAMTLAEVARVLRPGGHLVAITPNAHNAVVLLRQLLPNTLARRVVRQVYARDEDFINPTYYRANTPPTLDALLRAAGLARIVLSTHGDPTYLALNAALYRLSVWADAALERVWPGGLVHLVAHYRKPEIRLR